MQAYGNAGGDSGIESYEIGDDFVRVRFRHGRIYLYTYRSAGRFAVERMKTLATEGRGLATFISTTIPDKWEDRER